MNSDLQLSYKYPANVIQPTLDVRVHLPTDRLGKIPELLLCC